MKRNLPLTVTSLLSILFLSFHLTDDALRPRVSGTWESGPGNIIAVVVLFVFLFGTVTLAGRRSGYIIMLIGSLFAAAMPVLHLRAGVDWSTRDRAWFFLWTMIVLGVLGLFGFVLSAVGLWKREWRD
jgi:hypothetical protein